MATHVYVGVSSEQRFTADEYKEGKTKWDVYAEDPVNTKAIFPLGIQIKALYDALINDEEKLKFYTENFLFNENIEYFYEEVTSLWEIMAAHIGEINALRVKKSVPMFAISSRGKDVFVKVYERLLVNPTYAAANWNTQTRYSTMAVVHADLAGRTKSPITETTHLPVSDLKHPTHKMKWETKERIKASFLTPKEMKLASFLAKYYPDLMTSLQEITEMFIETELKECQTLDDWYEMYNGEQGNSKKNISSCMVGTSGRSWAQFNPVEISGSDIKIFSPIIQYWKNPHLYRGFYLKKGGAIVARGIVYLPAKRLTRLYSSSNKYGVEFKTQLKAKGFDPNGIDSYRLESGVLKLHPVKTKTGHVYPYPYFDRMAPGGDGYFYLNFANEEEKKEGVLTAYVNTGKKPDHVKYINPVFADGYLQANINSTPCHQCGAAVQMVQESLHTDDGIYFCGYRCMERADCVQALAVDGSTKVIHRTQAYKVPFYNDPNEFAYYTSLGVAIGYQCLPAIKGTLNEESLNPRRYTESQLFRFPNSLPVMSKDTYNRLVNGKPVNLEEEVQLFGVTSYREYEDFTMRLNNVAHRAIETAIDVTESDVVRNWLRQLMVNSVYVLADRVPVIINVAENIDIDCMSLRVNKKFMDLVTSEEEPGSEVEQSVSTFIEATLPRVNITIR
jgi:hypothetical protein